jgi:hypothetical protein
MCCRRAGVNITELFRVAAKESGINIDDVVLRRHVRIYLHGEEVVPWYVRKFIDDGKKQLNGRK